MSNTGNSADPCVESDCLQLVQRYPVEAVTITNDLLGGSGNLWQRTTEANGIDLILPGTDVGRCGVPKLVKGKLWGGPATNTRITAGQGGSGVGGTRNGYSRFWVTFEEPIDFVINTGSFNGGANAGFGESFQILTACDEFIAGAGSNLATNPNGYPAGTQYSDGNRGSSQWIWRQTVGPIQCRINGQDGLSCRASFTTLRYPEWIDPQCTEQVPLCWDQTSVELIRTPTAGSSGTRVFPSLEHVFAAVTVENIQPRIIVQRPISNCNGANVITIKRTDQIESSQLLIESADGIDGALNNFITLGLSNAFGIRSGESVTMVYEFDSLATVGSVDGTENTNFVSTDGTWRIV